MGIFRDTKPRGWGAQTKARDADWGKRKPVDTWGAQTKSKQGR